MRWMAGEATLLTFYGLMANSNFLTLFLMALKTERIPWSNSQARIFRAMGIMAGETHAILKGHMIDCSTCL